LRFEHEHLPNVERHQPVGTVTEPDVHFVGRLAEYRYYNMDQVVAAASP
jgi:UDP-galactopyranose mutase